jgi:hypothetical protein
MRRTSDLINLVNGLSKLRSYMSDNRMQHDIDLTAQVIVFRASNYY